MANPTDFALALFWLSERWRLFAWLGAILVSCVLLMLVVTPLSAGEQVFGTVEGFGFRETEGGSYPLAHVALEGRRLTVRLPRNHSCGVGDRIGINRYRSLLGQTFRADPTTACGVRSQLRANGKGL